MDRMPKIADVQCSRLKFEPGDRLIVRVRNDLDRDQRRKLLAGVRRWAGSDVEIMIVDVRVFDVEVGKVRSLRP